MATTLVLSFEEKTFNNTETGEVIEYCEYMLEINGIVCFIKPKDKTCEGVIKAFGNNLRKGVK